jgi:hypothetical protein
MAAEPCEIENHRSSRWIEERDPLLPWEGQNRRDIIIGINAQGNPILAVFMHIYDGQPHPTTGSSLSDAIAYTRVDAHTINYSLTKAGKLVETGTLVVSQDGKTLTVTEKGTNASGREYNDVLVYVGREPIAEPDHGHSPPRNLRR